jgi:hypothetical protein
MHRREIEVDERYPVYDLAPGEPAWDAWYVIALTDDELADLTRVTAEYSKWQERIGMAYKLEQSRKGVDG